MRNNPGDSSWEGACNSFKATDTPESNGLTITAGTGTIPVTGCNYQKSHATAATGDTCTGCKDGYGLLIMNQQRMCGRCLNFETQVSTYDGGKVHCTVLDADYWNSPVGPAMDTLCTKLVHTNSLLHLSHASIAPAVKTFFNSAIGLGGGGVAYCNAWKQTVCKSGTCTTLKEVTCSKVCKLVGWNYVADPPSPCYTALCQGESGAYACSHVAMML